MNFTRNWLVQNGDYCPLASFLTNISRHVLWFTKAETQKKNNIIYNYILYNIHFPDKIQIIIIILNFLYRKSDSGATPVHVAALSGNLNILSKLLTHNGDLRLHDKDGRTTKDWALMQPNPKKRLQMIEFLEKTRLFALTRSGHDFRDTTHSEHPNR